MFACSFFGHSDTPQEIEPILKRVLTEILETHTIKVFYVGNNGNFDAFVNRELISLANDFSFCHYIVLSHFPSLREQESFGAKIILPESIETVPKKFAIDYRNKWMINNSDFVITHVERDFGGAAKFKAIAEKKGKRVINI